MLPESWNEGYVTDIDYTHGYYRELSPSLQRFALICAGFAAPEEGAYLELGCGQGLSACIHAAATGCEIWATDFNPSQALHAIGLAQTAGLQVRIFDQSFAELSAREDMPRFSHIAAHGIWSWVSADNREVIVDILYRHLAVGGVAYLSYNTLPGWASAKPLRHLLYLHADLAGGSADGIGRQVKEAIDYAQRLAQVGAVYFKSHPEVGERLTNMATQDLQYLAHEYFNRDWHPMHFAECAKLLAAAKLEFAASANLLDHVNAINLGMEAQVLLRESDHAVLRETLRDYCVNQHFRRDLFTRGQRRLTALEQLELLQKYRIVLQTAGEDIPFDLNAPVGKIALQESIYRPLIEVLAREGYRPKSVAELRGLLTGLSLPQLLEALQVLVGMGHAHPCQAETLATKAQESAARLNQVICERACMADEIQFLASPVIGAGVMVSRLEQLFLLARNQSCATPEEWAGFAWQTLERQGFRLKKQGQRLEQPEENLAELVAQARTFAAQRLEILKALQIA